MISCCEKQHSVLAESLKQAVKWLLTNPSVNVWDACGSLPHVCNILDAILSHGLYYQGPEKYWNFISVLRVLTPEVAPPILPSEISGIKNIKDVCHQAEAWLHKSLVTHDLSKQIEALTQDINHLKDYYKENAFLRHASCVNVLLACLCAIEQKKLALLDNLDLALAPSLSTSEIAETAVQNNFKLCDSSYRYVPLQPGLDMRSNFLGRPDCVLKSSDSSPEGKKTYQLGNSKASPKRLQNKYSKHNVKLKNSTKIVKLPEGCSTVSSNHYKDDSKSRSLSRTNSFEEPSYNRFRTKELVNYLNYQLIHHSLSCSDLQSNANVAIRRINSYPNLYTLKLEHNHALSNKCNSEYKLTSSSFIDSNCDNVKEIQYCNPHHGYKSSESTNSILNKSLDSTWKAQHSRSKSDGSGITDMKCNGNSSHVCTEDVLSSSLPSVLLQPDQQKKKSIFEGGSVIVPTECFFPRPQPGQTLMSFLSSDFNICAELDRENAHFCISEALISAIEQIKCTESLKLAAEEAESDEEIKKLTQRIRIRRRERLQEKAARNAGFLNDGRADTTTTSQSASPMSTSHSSDFDAGDSIGSEDDDVADLDLSDHTVSNLTSVKESGLSLSLASMYSDADIHKGPYQPQNSDISEKRCDDSGSIQLSAEVVALSLLKRFSEKQLPKASDLEWLVSEQDAPQRLLPLPDSWPVSPDVIDEEYNLEKTRLRGNLEWAPPRQQIIFMIHPKPIKKDAILKQDYRCAGCGMRIEKSYVKKFRYCEYLGKFFCQCCHANNLAYIPGKILWKWDFRQYYVSKFSWKLLDQMFHDPLFNVMDINSKQYRKIKQLGLCRDYRMQLFYLKDFIRTCRDSKLLQREIDQLSEHIYTEPHLYSINDFLKVRNGDMSRHLSSLISKCMTHVMQCILCQGKGFICEMCNKSDDIIFPFQLTKVWRCAVCGCCFHKRCFKDGSCPKCVRIKERKRKLLEQKEQLYSDEEI